MAWTKRLMPWMVGVHLGLLQTGYLIGLQRTISAAHSTYALVVGAWLVVTLVGLWLRTRPSQLLLAGLATYLAAQLVLLPLHFTAKSGLWWAPAIAVSGLYSGRYFTAALATGAPVGLVFSRETTGFALGALVAFVLAVAWGRLALTLVPLVSYLGVVALSRHAPIRRCER